MTTYKNIKYRNLVAGDIPSLDTAKTTSGTFADARISASSVSQHATTYNDDQLQNNIAMLGFKAATNGSLVKYNLVDQIVDDFQDTSGVDAGNSTDEVRNASGKYYSGTSQLGGNATGGTITTYSSGGTDYKVHMFTSTANLVVAGAGNIDVLVVAGGGGGASQHSGGGGGGGILYNSSANNTDSNSSVAVSGATYVCTIGAGGNAAVAGSGEVGTNGGNSTFIGGSLSYTAIGGGRGGGYYTNNGAVGGSGGGGASAGNTNAGAGTSGQGNEGGDGANQGLQGGGGGGGGGAGAVGVNATTGSNSSGAGHGGNGKAYTGMGTSGTTYTWAGGGGGGNVNHQGVSYGAGNGGTGGGGGGGCIQESPGSGGTAGSGGTGGVNNGSAGELDTSSPWGDADGGAAGANTGGGGGAAGSNASAGATGGSGCIVVRYVEDSLQTDTYDDMTLQSVANTASATATKANMVMLMENSAGTATLNTDVKGYISANGGTNWTQGTLVDEGTWGTNKKVLAFHDLTLSNSGTDMRYKISTHNQAAGKITNIHAVSIGWL